ncbi:hypothetical protein ACLOJK_028315 [Asimina triloba]
MAVCPDHSRPTRGIIIQSQRGFFAKIPFKTKHPQRYLITVRWVPKNRRKGGGRGGEWSLVHKIWDLIPSREDQIVEARGSS